MGTLVVQYAVNTLWMGLSANMWQLLTGYGELMLAEFRYGLEPKETFSNIFDQSKSHR